MMKARFAGPFSKETKMLKDLFDLTVYVLAGALVLSAPFLGAML
jgi:hypothetical protein